MKSFKNLFPISLFLLLIFLTSCDKGEHTDGMIAIHDKIENSLPIVCFIQPSDTSNIYFNQPLNILYETKDLDGSVIKSELFINGVLIETFTDSICAFQYIPNVEEIGEFTILVKVYDDFGSVIEVPYNFEMRHYKTAYLGDFYFSGICKHYNGDGMLTIDTISYIGIIRDIAEDDNEFYGDDHNINWENRLTIKYTEYSSFSPVILEDGMFLEYNGSYPMDRYNGSFLGSDSIKFETHSGSLGSNSHYCITGKRIDDQK